MYQHVIAVGLEVRHVLEGNHDASGTHTHENPLGIGVALSTAQGNHRCDAAQGTEQLLVRLQHLALTYSSQGVVSCFRDPLRRVRPAAGEGNDGALRRTAEHRPRLFGRRGSGECGRVGVHVLTPATKGRRARGSHGSRCTSCDPRYLVSSEPWERRVNRTGSSVDGRLPRRTAPATGVYANGTPLRA